MVYDSLKMPDIFSDGMVFQRRAEIPVWGESDKEVTVVFRDKEYKVTPKNGHFRIDLEAAETETGLIFIVKNSDMEITYRDVAIGEVWIAGGQSNMEMMLKNTTDGMLDKQFEDADEDIRYYVPPRKKQDGFVTKNNKVGWIRNSEDDGSITAAGYYFARRLYQKLKCPVGIIDCNCGSTSIFHWIPKEKVLENPTTVPYALAQDSFLAGEYDLSYRDSIMGASFGAEYGYFYKNQFQYICPYKVKGVIWYQGEADGAGKRSAAIYKLAFRMLTAEWRKLLETETLPFITVLLANYGGEWIGSSCGTAWAYLREAQMELAETEESVYFVSAHDRGYENNIHPSEKKFVGERMAACALAEIYGMEIKWKCPTVRSIECREGKIMIYLKNTYGRIYSDCGSSKDFAVKTYLKTWGKYTAEIVGDHLEIQIGNIKPVEISHCFMNNPYVRIFNHYGLPLVPFRYKLQR